MSTRVVETPVEPLVLGDDYSVSYVPITDAVVTRKEMLSPSHVELTDDDDEEDEEGPSDLLRGAATSEPVEPLAQDRVHDLRLDIPSLVDTQNPLVQESDTLQSVVVEQTPELKDDEADEGVYAEKLECPEVAAESPHQQISESAPEAKAEPGVTLALLLDFLYHKIVENQCNSHAKEVLEFVTSNFTDAQLVKIAPQVVLMLSQKVQDEAKGQEVSVDIQTSLCLVEQMLLPVGRRSPLQDMYTAEEEEMLNQLAGPGGSSKNVLCL